MIHGRLVADPEIRKTSSKKSVCNFVVAVDRDYTDDEGNRETDFLDVVAWGQTADFLEKYFTKGQLIIVTGSLTKRFWEDENDERHYVTEIVARNVYFGGSKPSEDSKPKSNVKKARTRK